MPSEGTLSFDNLNTVPNVVMGEVLQVPAPRRARRAEQCTSVVVVQADELLV